MAISRKQRILKQIDGEKDALDAELRRFMDDLSASTARIGVEREKGLIGDVSNAIKAYEDAVNEGRVAIVFDQLDNHGVEAIYDLLYGKDENKTAKVYQRAWAEIIRRSRR